MLVAVGVLVFESLSGRQELTFFLALAAMVLIVARLFLVLHENVGAAESLRAAQRARRSDERYRRIVETTREGVWMLDGEGRTTFVNNQMAAMLGYTVDEMLGKTPWEFLDEEGREDAERKLAGQRFGEAGQIEVVHRHRNGSKVCTMMSTAPVLDDRGSYDGALAIVSDISAPKQAHDQLAKAEARYRQLVESLPGITYSSDPGAEGSWHYVSPQVEAILGYSPQEWCADGGLWSSRIHRDDRDRVVEAELRACAKSELFACEYRLVAKDGHEVWVRDEGVPVAGEDGSPVLEGMLLDITERKLAEAAIGEGHARLQDAQAMAHIGSWEWGFSDRTVIWSDELYRMFGLSRDGFTPTYERFLATIHPDDRERIRAVIDESFEQSQPSHYTYRMLRPDGEERVVETHGKVVLDDHGRSTRMVGTAQDVTEQRRADEALRTSEVAKAAILDSALDCVITMDADGLIREFNPAAEETFGYARDEVLGTKGGELIVPPELRQAHNEGFERAIATGHSKIVNSRRELVGMRSDGSRFPLEVAITRIGTDPHMFAGFLRDITERKRAEKELQLRAERQEAVAELGRAAVADVKADLMARAAAEVSEMLGTEFVKVMELTPSGDELVLRAAIGIEAHGPATTVPVAANTQASYTLRTPARVVVVEDLSEETRFESVSLLEEQPIVSGLSVAIEDKQVPVGVMSAHTAERRTFTKGDLQFVQSVANVLGAAITRERADALEQQLELSQRLETVGKLAGGVAHDFNNLLSVILNYARFAIDELDEGSPIREDVVEIEKAGARAAELTRQLLIFSRREVVTPEVLDVNAVVHDLQTLLERTLGEHIELRAKLDPNVARITMGPSQIEQVVVNLAINARDAMPEGGMLEIRTDDVDIDSASMYKEFGIEPGAYVRVTVSDTGTGMTKDVRAHAFEPFFTTKERGKGTGLGLATVYGAVRQAGGYVSIYSEPGRGTVVRVYFPATKERPRAPTPAPEAPASGHGERVLLVEDEDAVRAATNRILSEHGYAVTDAPSGEAAIEVISSLDRPPDLVLADVVMPGMSGPALAERLEALHPGLRTIYMSGYTDDMIARHGFVEEGVTLLEKPFSAGALLRMVRTTLDDEPAAQPTGDGTRD